jgi:hypothetical protein
MGCPNSPQNRPERLSETTHKALLWLDITLLTMPDDFPDDHELVTFFEAEPTLLDPTSPWFYNTLEFKTVRHGFVVECRLQPSYGEISTRLLVGDSELVRFDLQRFKSVRLIMDKNKELLRADFDRGHKQETFALILKPYVWLGFGDLGRVRAR